ncbi:hypothetical protein DVG78_23670 [Runella aurantiaca]|uniref:Uncharacterized protein n=1 Tax=Runella aurantiaca TaxID=2282308 RepID=A0A369I388_9BACT|nr:hypothetical protein DVG78_23670 [Runella aurantiaca]
MQRCEVLNYKKIGQKPPLVKFIYPISTFSQNSTNLKIIQPENSNLAVFRPIIFFTKMKSSLNSTTKIEKVQLFKILFTNQNVQKRHFDN